MRRRRLPLCIAFTILAVCFAGSSEAKSLLIEKDLKEKIKSKRIYMMYLVDGGIAGVETNQYGLPSGEFLVLGTYEEFPSEIQSLAEEYDVRIMPSQQTKQATFSSILMPIVAFLLYLIIFPGILIMLVLIYKRLSKIEGLLKKE